MKHELNDMNLKNKNIIIIMMMNQMKIPFIVESLKICIPRIQIGLRKDCRIEVSGIRVHTAT